MLQEDKENNDNTIAPTLQTDETNVHHPTKEIEEQLPELSPPSPQEEQLENDFLVTKKKSSSKEVIYVGNPTIANNDLQSSFLKFREQKLRERQLMKACQQIDITSQKRSEEYKNTLRMKFLEKAKSYLGVPYARRFQDPLIPEAPLYLDCCALIRKCVQDLSNEFGFIIGRWNQSYQMDTLPIVLEESQLQPGDLIFYEGIYNSKRSKPQKHNNVHVEIFLGGETGEATIGSRFYKGVVSIFPSYKFTSTSWSLVKHHFRSIDTWLNGVCKSCCPEHPWASDSLAYLEAAGKRSIFSDEHENRKNSSKDEQDDAGEADDEDVRADNYFEESDEEENLKVKEEENQTEAEIYVTKDEDEEGGGDGTEASSEEEEISIKRNNKITVPKPSSTEPLLRSRPSSAAQESGPRDKSKSMNDADIDYLPDPLLFAGSTLTNSPTKSLDQLSFSSESIPKVENNNSGKGLSPQKKASEPRVNRRILSKSLENERDLNTSNNSNRLKPMVLSTNESQSSLTGTSNKINRQNGGKESPQRYKPANKRVSKYASSNALNTEPEGKEQTLNFKVEGSNLNLRASATSGKVNALKRSVSLNAEETPTITVPINKTYYVCKSNGWKLVKAALDARGWQQLPFDYQFSSKYGLKWVERRSQIDYRSHQAGQLVCHIPNNDIITTKTGILTILRDKFCSKSIPAAQRKQYPPWLPLTFELESPSDVTALFDYLQQINKEEGKETKKEPVWIYKPSCNNRGRGIKVVSGIESLQLICYGKPAVLAPPGNMTTGGTKDSNNNLNNILEPAVEPLKGIVQKYIENPLLFYLSPEDLSKGYKFDIRCYLMIARTYPTTYAFYHPGYCRLALHPYSMEDLDDPFMHLTNASVQKKDTDVYSQNKDIQIQSVQAVAENMLAVGKDGSYRYIQQQLDHEIKLCLVDVMKACNNKLLKKHGYFDLLGCDFMITDDNRLHLLEINTNPALSLDNKVLEDLLPRVVDGALDLVLRTQGSDIGDLATVHIHPNDPLASQYQLIFDEKNSWTYSS